MTQATIDLIWWIGGGVVVAMGLALLVWALIGDRSRGRKRCPKCWYDMSSTPQREEGEFVGWVCPECGKRITEEHRMLRSRPVKRSVFVAVVVMAVGLLLIAQPRVQRLGWWSIVPSAVLVSMAQAIGVHESHFPSMMKELERRAVLNELSETQCVALGVAEISELVALGDRWPSDMPVRLRLDPTFWFSVLSSARVTLTPRDTALNRISILGEHLGQGTVMSWPEDDSDSDSFYGWCALGLLPPGYRTITFDCVVELGSTDLPTDRQFKPTRVVWRGTFEKRINVVRAHADAMSVFRGESADEAVKQALWIVVSLGEDGQIETSVTRKATKQCAGIILPVSITLERTDHTVLLGEATLMVRDKRSAHLQASPTGLPVGLDDPGWIVRVRGESRLARFDWRNPTFWVGEYTVPLAEVLWQGTQEVREGIDEPSKNAR